MNENISMTRIADLPINSSDGSLPFIQNQMQTQNGFNDSNIYIPLNPHPNPYEQPPQPPHPQPPQPLPTPPQYSEEIIQQQPEFRLPPRDIPMDITDFTHDEQVQPNYIPKPKLTADYVERHEEVTKTKTREYEEQKKIEANMNQWIDQMYQPIVLAFLYFLFQLPIINTLIFKRFSFLSIYKNDGNFNLFGLVLKSSLFASVFFLLHKSTQYIIDFFQ
jgi:hypothetical protein